MITAVLQDEGLGVDAGSLSLKLDGQPVTLPPGAYDADTGRLTYRPAEPFPERTQHIAVLSVQDLGGNAAESATTLFAIRSFSGGWVANEVAMAGEKKRWLASVACAAWIRFSVRIPPIFTRPSPSGRTRWASRSMP